MPILNDISDLLTHNNKFIYLDYISSIFELLYAYIVARHKYGFIHGDLYTGNILYQPANYNRYYQIKDKKYYIYSSYLLMFSDFENSSFDVYDSKDTKKDIFSLLNILKSLCYPLSSNNKIPILDFIDKLEGENIDKWISIIDSDSIFNILRRPMNLNNSIKYYDQLE